VTYADCTVGNHLYYGRYLELLEAARGALFRELGWPFTRLEAEDVALPVIRVEVDYRTAARYDDLVQVDVHLLDLGRVKLAFGYVLETAEGRASVPARTFHGITTHGDRPRRLPAPLQEALAALGQG